MSRYARHADMNTMKIKPWFEPGFNEAIKATIEQHWPANPTIVCHDEAHRWAKVLLELMPGCDIELNDGMFYFNGDLSHNCGHSWLVVDGRIFDPTAAQFDGNLDPSYYVDHDSCSGPELPKRLAWWQDFQAKNRFYELVDLPSEENSFRP